MSTKHFETEAIRTQLERSQFQEHSTPFYDDDHSPFQAHSTHTYPKTHLALWHLAVSLKDSLKPPKPKQRSQFYFRKNFDSLLTADNAWRRSCQ